TNGIFLANYGQQVERGTYPALHRTSAKRKRDTRIIPKPAVVTVTSGNPPCLLP
ncbi:hypothetical protein H0H92_010295, partial [Tricholoma furcatifolium]